MIRQNIHRILYHLGYEIQKISVSPSQTSPRKKTGNLIVKPPSLDPVWPLPRHADWFSDEKIHKEFAKYDRWHYAYKFEGGISFSARHKNPSSLADIPERPLQRFRHFMPYLVESQHGTLKGKRILDIACNSGFWSIQCALLGAEVIGFDARPELIEQANLIKSIVGVNNVEFKVLDFWEMSPQSLNGTFDIVLNLGILYRLSKPLEALELTKSMARKNILLDTAVCPTNNSMVEFRWDEPWDIQYANSAGIVAYPSKSSIDLMLRHIDAIEWFEIPIHTGDIPPDYLDHTRASWLITV